MQDNAQAHYAATTHQELEERQIQVITWPPYSPDLNPIEMVWNKMKNYIQEHFGEKLGQDALRNAIMEAWNAVETSYLAELVIEMLARC
jgi:transposase